MKLLDAEQKMRDVIRLRHLSISTEECYLGWLRRFARFVGERSPEGTPAQKMERFLTQLAHQGISASAQNQAFNALLFFYRETLGLDVGKVDSLRARRPVMIRTAPDIAEVRALLAAVKDVHDYPTRLIVHLLYGCGLRVSEPLNLRVKDVLLAQSRLILRGAKGGKDRMVPLPCSLVIELRDQLRHARIIWERDVKNSIPVKLPGLLEKKYPHWQFAWQWAFVFPSHKPCADPRSGKIVRWRCHEANVQKAVKLAARPLGLCLTPHHLRHAYATHTIQAGANIRDVQEAMGHANMETTAGYLTPRACAVPSPLDVGCSMLDVGCSPRREYILRPA